ncbi:hypothetical protein ACI7RC_23465 [Brevibacillus sp. B_LB10_24]|uniref:hypothetical protein n=1 Tax=Brevibacillus sp. B_LB10_24 TaxID=3380645 RepID=UPI0038BAE516
MTTLDEGVIQMITCEQAPFVRIAARLALEKGVISQERYDEMIRDIEQIEAEQQKVNERLLRITKSKILEDKQIV